MGLARLVRSFAGGTGMLNEKDTIWNARASSDRYFLSVLGDVRLRDSEDLSNEHIPLSG
jgi:hypothetical protein